MVRAFRLGEGASQFRKILSSRLSMPAFCRLRNSLRSNSPRRQEHEKHKLPSIWSEPLPCPSPDERCGPHILLPVAEDGSPEHNCVAKSPAFLYIK